MTISIDNNAIADLLEAELTIINTHLNHDRRAYMDIGDIKRVDDLHALADSLIYNRRIIQEHLMRAEGILTAVYPEEFGSKEPGWLYSGLLESWIKTVREDPGLSKYRDASGEVEG